MIIQLHRQPTGLSHLLEIPTSFFRIIEWTDEYDDDMFPNWFNEVFGSTNSNKDGLYIKFKNLFEAYKKIQSPKRRAEIINAYNDGIQIENLCNRIPNIEAFTIDSFPEISSELKIALMHLWNNSLQYEKFENLKAKTTIKKYAKDFIDSHNSQICPFCGLEGYLYVDGQSRPALDHWLSKDDFPYSSVNFENLIPIGDKCNESPAKGTKDVLKITNGNTVFYPFTKHDGIVVIIKNTSIPKLPGLDEDVYEIEVKPKNSLHQDLFDSWDSLFNIKKNYKSFLKGTLLNSWKTTYKNYIIKSKKLKQADNVEEFIDNLEHWQDSFQPNITIGFLVYDAFVENLLSMPKSHLYGLCEYFKRA